MDYTINVEKFYNIKLNYKVIVNKTPQFKIKSEELFIKLNNIKHIKIIEYNYNTRKVTVQCSKSGIIYECRVEAIYNKCNCKVCISERISQRTKEAMQRPDVKANFEKGMRNVDRIKHSKNCSIGQRKRYSNPIERELNQKRQKKIAENPEFRKKISISINKKYNDRDFKMRVLNGQANNQRKKKSKYELFVIKFFEQNSIRYIWQYSILLKEFGLPFDAIIDFYLPDYDLYINCNLDKYHRANKGVKNKDEILKKFFKDKIFEINNYSAFDELLKILKGGDENDKH